MHILPLFRHSALIGSLVGYGVWMVMSWRIVFIPCMYPCFWIPHFCDMTSLCTPPLSPILIYLASLSRHSVLRYGIQWNVSRVGIESPSFISSPLIKPSSVSFSVIPYCDTESSGIEHKRGKSLFYSLSPCMKKGDCADGLGHNPL